MAYFDAYEGDLERIRQPYRTWVRHYLERGVIPPSRGLKALLAGDKELAIQQLDGALEPIVRFMTRHAPSFAWGSVLAMAKWEYIGGLETRIRRKQEVDA